jgi:DNA-binding beta-propeller fold protein YncE
MLRRRLGSVAALLLIVALAPAGRAVSTAVTVRVTRTSAWTPPSPDTGGITYMPAERRLIVTDSEVDETNVWAGKNVWFTTLKGRPIRSFSTARYTKEPTDVAVGKKGLTLYFSDDDLHRIFIVHRGPDRRWGTWDDPVSSFSTLSFGSRDAEGIAFGGRSLFVTDGKVTHLIFRLRPGPNGRFDGAPPAGDDVVTQFDTGPLGLSVPEGVAFDHASHHLYITGRRSRVILITTVNGALLNRIDISFSGIVYPSGIALAPASDGSSKTHVYVVARGVDNNADPGENDGKLFEFALA